MFAKKAEKECAATEYTPSRVLTSVYEWISAAIAALVVVAILFTGILRVVNVSGNSMMTTLHNGDRLIISNLFYTPDYGDIVVVTRVNNTPLIKRVIGLPGDRIRIDETTGIVYRNDEALDEPYVFGGFTPTNNMNGETTVPEGYFFLMGDNRCDSLDSRMLGSISQENLVGRVLFRMSPNPGVV